MLQLYTEKGNMKLLTIAGKSVIPALAGALIYSFTWGVTGSVGAGLLLGGVGAFLLFLKISS